VILGKKLKGKYGGIDYGGHLLRSASKEVEKVATGMVIVSGWVFIGKERVGYGERRGTKEGPLWFDRGVGLPFKVV